MSQDELAVMDGGKCILQLRGVRPFLSEKYDITAHPNYKYLSDANIKNTFDMERYMKKRKPIVKKNEVFDSYKISLPSEPDKTESAADETKKSQNEQEEI